MITFILRIVPLLAFALLVHVAWAAPMAPAAMPAEAIAARGAVTVRGPELHLGDLFTNVGDMASVRVGSAPPPGSPLTIDAPTLQRIAIANKLSWRPASMHERTVVERDSVAVTNDEITAAVLMALMQKGIPTEGLEVELTLGTRQYYRPCEGQMQIDTVTVDPSGSRFAAIVAIVTPGEPRQTVAITGRLQRTVGVPVLLRPLRSGEVIDEHAVGWVQLPDRQVSSNAVRDRRTLVGQSARRALAPGAPVLVSDLRPTQTLAKGQPVTLLLQLPGMQLTARGIALEAGAIGATIPVLNERSKTTVHGVVTSGNTVTVATMLAR